MDFFNDLGKKFSQAARTVQVRTRESVESTKLAVDIRAARAELHDRYAELGRAYYESISGGAAGVDEALIRSVRESIAQIESLNQQRDRVNRQTRCPACGSVQSEEARFCANCGRAMPEKGPELSAAPVEEEQYCDQCGAMRGNQARFCEVCGSAFDQEDNPPALQAAPIVEVPSPEEPADTNAE